jgi:hypothetical protein
MKEQLEFKLWDRRLPIVIRGTDTYFYREDDLVSYCQDEDIKIESLDLMICEPQFGKEITSEYFAEVLYDDCCLESEFESEFPALAGKLEELNKLISSTPMSYKEGRFRAKI